MSNQILVFFGTNYGQTAKIARYIAERLASHGCSARLVNGDAPPPDVSIADFDGVIIGGSIIRGRHQECVRRFVRLHRDALNAMPSAFFSVSGSAASRNEAGKQEARECIDRFLRETAWRPGVVESVAGAMAFTKYNPFVRWMLKQISKRNGGPTDTSRDHELTDWSQVERFADAFLDRLPQRGEASLAAVPGE